MIYRDPTTGVRETEWKKRKRLEKEVPSCPPLRLIPYTVYTLVDLFPTEQRLRFRDDSHARHYGKTDSDIRMIRRGFDGTGPVVYRLVEPERRRRKKGIPK